MVTMGQTMLLATVCSAQDAVPGTDFYATNGRIQRNSHQTDVSRRFHTPRRSRIRTEILIARLIVRFALFPADYHAETFVNVTLYSADGIDMPDSIAGLAASAALMVSDIPFEGPISEVRVARIDGKFVINPTFEQLEKADIDLIVAATLDNIMMVEGEMREVSETEMLEAIKIAHEAIKPQCQVQLELMEAVGKTEKRTYCHEERRRFAQSRTRHLLR